MAMARRRTGKQYRAEQETQNESRGREGPAIARPNGKGHSAMGKPAWLEAALVLYMLEPQLRYGVPTKLHLTQGSLQL